MRHPWQQWVGVLLLLLGLGPVPAAAADPAATPYLLQPGDVLGISVWKEEGMDREVVVLPDGTISYPLVNVVQAAGKSVAALRAELVKRLQHFIPDPVVTVDMRKLNGNKVYVIGKVNRPGEYPTGNYVDVVQALAMAGGMTPYAAANKIEILRRVNGKLQALPFRYGDIEKGRHLEQNIILHSRDVVLVP